jgi:probable HAF family extracellular repeat protein
VAGQQEAAAVDINDSGTVVGRVSWATGTRIFLAGPSIPELSPQITESTMAMASAINDLGEIVGFIDGAAVMLAGGGVRELWAFNGWGAMPYDINNSTLIVGVARANDSNVSRAVMYTRDTGPLDIGTIGGMNSAAYGINEAGEVVGVSETDDGREEAFYFPGWSDPYNPDPNAEPRGIGTLGGLESAAYAINNRHEIAGQADTAAQRPHAFLYHADSGMLDLGTLGGAASKASDINDSGVVVGWAETAEGARHAFVYDHAHRMRDLNLLLKDGEDWILVEAAAINSRGQIVGRGTVQGASAAFLLTPQ